MVRTLLVIAIASLAIAAPARASTVYNANSSQMGHLIGAAASPTSWAVASSSPAGVLTYGPYVTQFQNGAYRASFELKVDNNAADDQTIGALDVYDGVSHSVLARREFHRKDFAAAGVAQRFDVTFVTRGTNRLEFRVFYNGFSYLEHLTTTIDLIGDLGDAAQYAGAASTLFHQLGNAGPLSSWEAGSSAGPGVLSYGPYTTQFTAGGYRAVFALMIDNTTADNLDVITIDAFESTAGRVLASRTLTRHAFAAPFVAQTFELPFAYSGAGPLEFRVQVTGASYVRHVSTSVSHAAPLAWNGNDPQLGHLIGSAAGTGWAAPSTAGPGYLSYGPYTTAVPVGPATATFTLLEDNNTADNLVVARIEATDAITGSVVASRLIRRKNFWAAGTAQTFDLVFEIARPAQLEFRVYAYGTTYLDHLSTVVNPDRVSLTSLWNGATHFEFRKRDVFDAGEGATASLVVLDGIWYAFNRQAFTKPGCGGNVAIRSVIRQSFDHGQTWSSPVTIVEPSASVTAIDGCDVVDGSGFYDADTDTWHYLTQCLGTSSWSLCHYTRAGMLPMGTFAPDPANPVVRGGQLWGAICAGAGKHCPTSTVDEGTPQIIAKTNGQFVVTFHGAAYGAVVNGYRGMATTADFHTWQTAGAGLPGDALMSPVECNPWGGWNAGGCIGVGAARVLRSDGYNYMLTEAADNSLGCTAGQHWVFGLLRNQSMGASGSWTNYSANAFVMNQNISPVGCALQYMNVVRDRGEIYLVFALYTPEYGFPNYDYQLVSGAGPAKLLAK